MHAAVNMRIICGRSVHSAFCFQLDVHYAYLSEPTQLSTLTDGARRTFGFICTYDVSDLRIPIDTVTLPMLSALIKVVAATGL